MKTARASKIFYHFLVLAVIAGFIFPFVLMLLASFKTQADIMSIEHFFWFRPTLQNYEFVLQGQDFLNDMVNSLLIGLGSTLAALILGLPASYAIARYRMEGMGVVVLVVKIIPGITFLIPWFMMFTALHLVDTHLALILSHMLIGLPYIVWIMIPFFKSMSREMEEAALIDGCLQWQVFAKIVLPISTPGAITCALLAFIHSWNNFLFSLVLSGDHTKTLPVAIFNFLSYAVINWGGLMTAACIITLPVLIIAFLSQRYIVAGLSAGAVKG